MVKKFSGDFGIFAGYCSGELSQGKWFFADKRTHETTEKRTAEKHGNCNLSVEFLFCNHSFRAKTFLNLNNNSTDRLPGILFKKLLQKNLRTSA
jgi:hypothetical protein